MLTGNFIQPTSLLSTARIQSNPFGWMDKLHSVPDPEGFWQTLMAGFQFLDHFFHNIASSLRTGYSLYIMMENKANN